MRHLVDSWELDIGWIVGNVHQGGIDHLVVDGVLCGSSHAAGTSIQIVDEQRAHASLQ